MTDESRGTRAAGPPWSVDVLADLHAGVLPEHEAAELWPRVQADPGARAILDALQATTTDLARLNDAPVEPIPADVAARLDAAIAGEVQRAGMTAPAATPMPPPASGQGQVVDLTAARRRRNQRIGWISGIVAVAAAAIAVVAIVLPNSGDTKGTPVAAPAPSIGAQQPGETAGLALRSDQPQSAIGPLSTGVKDYGPLGDAQRLAACLRSAGVAPTADPIGVRPGTLDGAPAVFALLKTGRLAEFRLVAVSPECGPRPLLDKVIGK